MSKNSLSDLNNYLFQQLDRLNNNELGQESIEREVKRTEAIVSLSEQVIDNAKIALDAAELVAKHGVGKWEDMLPLVENKPKSPGIANYKKEVIE